MKAVKRWRYYCEHCKKVSGLRTAMEKHEKGCTLNPNRDCGICGFLNTGGAALADLIALLPDPTKFERREKMNLGLGLGETEWDETDYVAMTAATHAVLPKLRDLTDNCPACILAALRQRGIPVPLVENFNLTEEMKAARERMSGHRSEQHPYY